MRKITIIGGLIDLPRRDDVISACRAMCANTDWDYIEARETDGYQPIEGRLNRFVASSIASQKKREVCLVLKLNRLHQRSQAKLYQGCRDPIIVPREIETLPALVEWIKSAEANLIPRQEWYANAKEAALIAILAKLVSKRSWNKDTKGHAWTCQEHLLNDGTVNDSSFPQIRAEAARILPGLRDKLLIRKGANQGNTPLEWCIDLRALPAVKTAILSRSLKPLEQICGKAFIESICADPNRQYQVDGKIVNERIRILCQPANSNRPPPTSDTLTV